MKNFALIIFFFIGSSFFNYSFAQEITARPDHVEVRHEFEDLFGNMKFYQVIRKHLPDTYEELFRSYLHAKRSNNMAEFKISPFVNQIRNSYLKQSSDTCLYEFYKHIIDTGRNLFEKDPDAAFSYVFGGNPQQYSAYVDLQQELEKVGGLFDRILSTKTRDNMLNIDVAEAENGLTIVFLDLFYKYGDSLDLLHNKQHTRMSMDERHALCDIYLNMYESIFRLESPTRYHVLRSLAMDM